MSTRERARVEVARIDPLVDPRWGRLLERRASSVFHSPAWLRVLADTYGFEVGAHVALDADSEPVAGLPFCRLADVFGERIVSLPFSDFCDPLVGSRAEWEGLIAPLVAERRPITLRPLHSDVPLSDERFAVVKRAKWHGLDLAPDLDAQWRRLAGNTRRGIEKPRRDGVVVRVAESSEELRAFFELHLRVRKYKYRLLAQPFSFFENIWREFQATGAGALLFALYEGQVIGASFFLEWKDTLYYKFNASSPEHLAHRPNDLLIWQAIEYGKARGLAGLDFGLSDWDQEGLIGYKRKFATEEKTISFLKHVPEGAPAANGQLGALFGHLTDLLTDGAVPDGATERAGELLYRYFA